MLLHRLNRLIRTEGIVMHPFREWLEEVWDKEYADSYPSERGQCYANCQLIGVFAEEEFPDLLYMEGYCEFPHKLDYGYCHAWLYDEEADEIFDPTPNYGVEGSFYWPHLEMRIGSDEFSPIGAEGGPGALISDIPGGLPGLRICNIQWTRPKIEKNEG